ncbi:MAG: MerR family transcriptional regulator [Gammaproteobacteria bacterium]|nr:MerR family transcriptional regulator [Gammaproteobacteria bacterium]
MPATTRREYTIGTLARRARVAPSVLRYYEKEGLLVPSGRTAAGYRLYGADAEKTLLFINRAKRLGFSLDDIRQFLAAGQTEAGRKNNGKTGDVARIAEDRFLEIERRLTELLVLRHELEVFLREMSEQLPAEDGARRLYRRLVERVCGHSSTPQDEAASLTSLMKRMGCNLASLKRGKSLDILRGRHIHVWRETDGYSVLVPGNDSQIGVALKQIATSEAGCEAHAEPKVELTTEGYVFSAHGNNAFLFAQFFLALEHHVPA